LAFITGMVVNAQVSQTQVFATTEEIHFVSDDGGGMYTVSGPGAGDDGFLAIYDENMPPNSRWEVKDFPPRSDLGSVHEAYTHIAYTLQDGSSFAVGKIASSSGSDWYGVRKYNANSQIYSHEKVVKDVAGIFLYRGNNDIYLVIGKTSTTDLLNSGWNMQGEGWFIGKLNPQDLSLEWSYRLGNSWNTDWQLVYIDPLISTNKAYRYAVQQLPNGNIAVTVVRLLSGQTPDREYQLWEFDPATGQKLGVIDDSYTDYDRNGTTEMQYRFHRWKIIDGVLFHEFWNDPNNSQDAQIGHWEKLEIPGYTPGTSGHTAGWTSANLQVTAVSDWETYDSFGYLPKDFWIDSEGKMRFEGVHLSENLALYKVERMSANISDNMDEWVAPTGERMVMTRHSLIRVTYNEMFTSHIQTAAGNNTTEARNDEIYANGEWKSVHGEGTIVVDHSAMPQAGDSPDSSWWTIPSGFHYVGATPIKESHDQVTDGLLYFYVDAIRDGENVDANEMLLRIWIVDANTVSVPEMEVSGLKLYPNPVQDYLTVSADDDIDTVRVYNLLGVIVSESNSNSVYMGNLAHGVYIAEVISGDKMSRKKIIKK